MVNIYRLILWLRHKCYDRGIFKSAAVDFPVLSIGNITVGGTGKTPHTELVLRMFSQQMPMAVLSGGYKRKSKGFRYVGPADSVLDVGDEPLQIKRKFPDAVVAVDTDRVAAIKRIRQDHPQVKLIVLDDAFQYRRLKPSYSILLSDYHRPYPKDTLLPFGKLRDLPSQAKRADLIIVTKTPPDVSPEAQKNQHQIIKPESHQQLLFSRYTYSAPYPLFSDSAGASPLPQPPATVIALTGIAHPDPFLQEIKGRASIVQHLKFPDHHNFTPKDIAQINQAAARHPHAAVYTTEKDAMRLLMATGLSQQAKASLYYIEVQVDFCSRKERQQFVEIVTKLTIFATSHH